MPLIAKQYYHCGTREENRNFQILQKSYADYEYFASGRKNNWYTEFKINLIRRHCFFTKNIADVYIGNKDTITIEAPIDMGGKEYPMEFLVCKRKDLKSKMAQFDHLDGDFIKNSNAKHYRLGEKDLSKKNALMIMSEHDEIANQIIDEFVGKALLSLEDTGLLHEIHITDQKVYNNFPLFFRMVIEIPGMNDTQGNEKALLLHQVAYHIIDLIASLKMSKTAHEKCEKNRVKQKKAAIAQKQ